MHIGYRKSHSNVAAVICERGSGHICTKHPLIFRHLWFSMWPLSTIKVWQPHSWAMRQMGMAVPLCRRARRRGQCETRSGVSASLSTPPLGHCSFWQRLVLFLTSQDFGVCSQLARSTAVTAGVAALRQDCAHFLCLYSLRGNSRRSAHAAPAATRSRWM